MSDVKLIRLTYANAAAGSMSREDFPLSAAGYAALKVLAAYGDLLVEADASGGPVTYTLPAAVAARAGFEVSVVKIDTSANLVTIDGNGAELVAGELTQTLALQGEVLTLRCTGTQWWAV